MESSEKTTESFESFTKIHILIAFLTILICLGAERSIDQKEIQNQLKVLDRIFLLSSITKDITNKEKPCFDDAANKEKPWSMKP
jgi:hypothetical protein